MKNIPTMFERDWDGDRSRVLDIPHRDCAWVFAGEGVATRKYDGMCCMFDGAVWWKRREIKPGQVDPSGFDPVSTDDETGKTIGWVPIGDGPEDQYMRAAINLGCSLAADRVSEVVPFRPGTYEFLGEKSQGNVEKIVGHWFIAHADAAILEAAPRTFEGLRLYLEAFDIEGIVFHHPDGRMAKIKKRDFGLKRAVVA